MERVLPEDAMLTSGMTDEPATGACDAPTVEDARLLMRWRERGDREALGELVRRHADAAFAVALRMSQNRSDAEDAVQDGVVAVMTNARHYRATSGGSVRSWILAIVAHAAHRRGREDRRRASREHAHGPDLLRPTAAADPELAAVVGDALGELPISMRAPILLRHADQLSIPDIAAALGRKEKTIRSQIDRGLEQLRAILARRGRASASVAIVAMVGACEPARAGESLLARLDQTAATQASAIGGGPALAWLLAAVMALVACALAVSIALLRGGGRDPAAPSGPPIARVASPSAVVNPTDPVADAPGFADVLLGRMCDADGHALDGGADLHTTRQPHGWMPAWGARPLLTSPAWATGIKALDWCAPIVRGGRIALYGGRGVGREVLILELVERMRLSGGRAILVGADDNKGDGRGLFADMRKLPLMHAACLIWQEGPASADDMRRSLVIAAKIAAAWRDAQHEALLVTLLPRRDAASVEDVAAATGIAGGVPVTWIEGMPLNEPLPEGPLAAGIDSRIVIADQPESLGDYPLVDPQRCATRMVDADAAHQRIRASAMAALAQLRARAIAVGARAALADERLAAAARLHAYLTQPFFTTAGFTGIPGCSVAPPDLWSDMERILRGECDGASVPSLRYHGALAPR